MSRQTEPLTAVEQSLVRAIARAVAAELRAENAKAPAVREDHRRSVQRAVAGQDSVAPPQDSTPPGGARC